MIITMSNADKKMFSHLISYPRLSRSRNLKPEDVVVDVESAQKNSSDSCHKCLSVRGKSKTGATQSPSLTRMRSR